MLERCCLAALLCLPLACAEGELDPAPAAPATGDDFVTKLINGRFTFEHPEAGQMTLNGGSCTGTLVRDNVVATAAHCVDFQTRDNRGRAMGTFIVHDGEGRAHRYPIDAIVSYGGNFDPSSTDVALMRLTERVPANVARPAPIARNKPSAGTPVSIYGYGCGNRRNTNDAHQGRKQKFSFAQGFSAVLCPGDSGGPTYVDADGSIFQVNSAYLGDGRGTDVFGDLVRIRDTLEAQATAWSGNAGGQPEPPEPEQPERPEPEQPDGPGVEPAPEPPVQDLSCGPLWRCLLDCRGERRCLQGCGLRARPDSRRTYDALSACSRANTCRDRACIDRVCGAQAQACESDRGAPEPAPEEPRLEPEPEPDPEPEPEPEGGLDCPGVHACALSCPWYGDLPCIRHCFSQGSLAAQQAYESLSACGRAQFCGDDGCYRYFCRADYDRCFQGATSAGYSEPSGSRCADVIHCFGRCGGDSGCADACYAEAAAPERRRVDALYACAQANACEDFDCVEQRCAAEFGACF